MGIYEGPEITCFIAQGISGTSGLTKNSRFLFFLFFLQGVKKRRPHSFPPTQIRASCSEIRSDWNSHWRVRKRERGKEKLKPRRRKQGILGVIGTKNAKGLNDVLGGPRGGS